MAGVRFFAGLALAVVVQALGTLAWAAFPALVDAPLVVAILASRHGRPERALVAGTLAGWAADALSGGPFGLLGFADAAVAYAAALAAERLVFDRTATLAGLLAAAAAAQGVLLVGLGVIFLDARELPRAEHLLARVATAAALGLAWVGLAALARRRWRGWRAARPRGGLRVR